MKVKRIVVATDFSEAATAAIAQSLPIARHLGAEVIIVHAGLASEGSDTHSKYGGFERDVRDWEITKLSEDRLALGRIREQFSDQGVDVSQAFLNGHPPAAICQAAKALEADLIVLGSHGRSGIGRLLIGSTVVALTRSCRANVLVVRPPICAEGFRRILVPVDFEHEPDRPVEGALALAGSGTEIHILHCWHLPFGLIESWGYTQTPMINQIRHAMGEQFDAMLNELVLRNRRPGIAMFADHMEAVARHGILAHLDSSEYDLVVVGSHGRRGLNRWLLGSVAETTIRHAHSSVLVVK